jgi:hypothetical protein
VRLHLVTCTYDTISGATVEIRRHLFQPPTWNCTGCPTWGNTGDLHQAANNHAGNCRARPRKA